MAGVKDPPDKSCKKYACHPDIKAPNIRICILCESIYHTQDLEKEGGLKFEDSMLCICNNHTDLNLTSNYDTSALSETARIIITQIKSQEKMKLQIDLQNSITIAENSKSLNDTVVEDEELINTKKENILLRQLNNELMEKNTLLKEKIELNKIDNKKSLEKSYAQALTDIPPKQKIIPNIIIKKKNKNDNTVIKEKVTHYLNKEKSIQVKKVFFKSDSEAIISCASDECAEKAKSYLKSKMQLYTIEKEEVKQPRMKIIGVDNNENMSLKCLEDDINERNFKNFDTKCKVIHKFKNKKNDKETVFIEVSADIYKQIVKNKNKIYVGYQNCKVYDDLNLQPCYNCGRFGHSGKKCINNKICLKCAGNHNSVYCTKSNQELCCVNCIYSNNKYNTNYDVKHVANDSHNCQILIKKIKKQIANTDYPYKPVIQRYIGKVDITPNNLNSPSSELSTITSKKSHSLLSLTPKST